MRRAGVQQSSGAVLQCGAHCQVVELVIEYRLSNEGSRWGRELRGSFRNTKCCVVLRSIRLLERRARGYQKLCGGKRCLLELLWPVVITCHFRPQSVMLTAET
jgi:hypothetical protein